MVNEMRRGRRGGTARTSSGALCVHLEHEDEEGEQEKETAQGLREGGGHARTQLRFRVVADEAGVEGAQGTGRGRRAHIPVNHPVAHTMRKE